MAPQATKRNAKKGKKIAKTVQSNSEYPNTRSRLHSLVSEEDGNPIPSTSRQADEADEERYEYFRKRQISVGSKPKSVIKKSLIANDEESSDTSSATKVPKKKLKKSIEENEKGLSTPSKNNTPQAPEEGKLLRSGRKIVSKVFQKEKQNVPTVKKAGKLLKTPMKIRRWRKMKNDVNTDLNKINFECEKGYCSFKVCSWDVNGIYSAVRNKAVDYIMKEDADIVCIQNIRCKDVPPEIYTLAKYCKYMFVEEKDDGQPAGVLVLSKEKPLNAKGWIQDLKKDIAARVLLYEFEDFYMVCAAAPHWGDPKYNGIKRRKWDRAFRKYIHLKEKEKPIIVCASMNLAHTMLDSSKMADPQLGRPTLNKIKKLPIYKKKLRDNMTKLLDGRFVDTFRHLYPTKREYSYFPAAWNSRHFNVGWRLDYIIVSNSMKSLLCSHEIRTEVKSSVHCPIVLCFLKQSLTRPYRTTTEETDSDSSSSDEDCEDFDKSYPLSVICLDSYVSEMADQMEKLYLLQDPDQHMEGDTDENNRNLGIHFLQRRTYGGANSEDLGAAEALLGLRNLQLERVQKNNEDEDSGSTDACEIDTDEITDDDTDVSGVFPESESISEMDQSSNGSPNVLEVFDENLPPVIADMLNKVLTPEPSDE